MPELEYYVERTATHEYTIRIFFKQDDYAEMFQSLGMDLENTLTPKERSRHWTMYKDAYLHNILQEYIFDEDDFVYFIIHDTVYRNQVTFHVRPSFHLTFFCQCFMFNFLSNFMYEDIPTANEAPNIHSQELYCFETM